MGNKGFYTVPFVWGRGVWVTTFATFALWLGLSLFMLYIACTQEDIVRPVISLVLFNAIMLPMILVSEGMAPQRLEIGESKIVILRRYRSIAIRRDEVRSVERLPDNALRGALRVGGNGGLFGYYGSYYTRKLGSFELYATRLDNLFLVHLWSGKRIVISCAEPDKMEGWLSL
ncbi:MAG: hypothetical protein IKA70_02020 [Alistipes sp.]|nr:hypothetical protein [Alistipes sp.]